MLLTVYGVRVMGEREGEGVKWGNALNICPSLPQTLASLVPGPNQISVTMVTDALTRDYQEHLPSRI